jgi:MFS family permease
MSNPSHDAGLSRPARRRYWLCMAIDSFGYGAYLPLSLLYFHRVTGLPIARVGFILTAAALIALAFGNTLSGTLVDRYSARAVLVGGYLVRALGFGAYALVSNQAEMFVTATLVALGTISFQPAIQALVAEMARGHSRDRLIAAQRSIRNAGLGGGALIASAIVSLHSIAAYRAIVLIGGVSFLAAALLVLGIRVARSQQPGAAAAQIVAGEARTGSQAGAASEAGASAAQGAAERGGYRAVLRNRPFFLLTMITFPVALGYMVLSVSIPVYITQVLHASAAWAGLMYAFNTAGIAFLQIPVTRALSRIRRTRACVLGQTMFGLAFVTYAAAAALPRGTPVLIGLFAGTAMITAGELLHSATTYALTASAAPDRQRGRHLAFYQFSWEIPRAAAPAVLTALLAASPTAMWLLLAAGMAGSALFLIRLEPRLPVEAVYPAPYAATPPKSAPATATAATRMAVPRGDTTVV